MRQVARGSLIALMLVIGLVVGVGGLIGALLLGVRPPALAAAAPAQSWDVTLTMSDTFLSARVGQGGKNGQGGQGGQGGSPPVALQGAKVVCQADGTVTITGNVAPGGPVAASVPVEIVLRPTVADGQLKTAVVSAQFGPLPVPGQLDTLLDGPINSRVSSAVGNQPFRLVDLAVKQGQLTVRVKRA